MISKPANACLPVFLLALGVAASRYLPGRNRLPLKRPVKWNVLVPAARLIVKPPFSVTMRLHLGLSLFFFVRRSHLVRSPCLTFRPDSTRRTVSPTCAATLSVKVTLAPYARAAPALVFTEGPDGAAGNACGAMAISPTAGSGTTGGLSENRSMRPAGPSAPP